MKLLLRKKDVIFFIGLYCFSLIVVSLFSDQIGFSYIDYITFYAGISILLCLTLIVTKNIKPREITTKNDLTESSVLYGWTILMILTLFNFIFTLRSLGITSGIYITVINAIFNSITLFLIPLITLVYIRKYSYDSLGFSKDQLKKNAIASIIVFVGILVAIFIVQITIFENDISYVITQLPLALIQNLFIAALPEEFIFRATIQTRMSNKYESKVRGIIITTLLFGVLHAISWGQSGNYSIELIFLLIFRAIVFQALIGLVFGIMWARTHNLILPIIAHMAWNCIYL